MSDIEKIDLYQNIWEKFVGGDEGALSSIYFEFFDMLLNFGMKYSSDCFLVEDCIQNLFVDLLKNRQKQKPVTNVRFYLLKALRNQMASEQRKTKKMSTVEEQGAYNVPNSFDTSDLLGWYEVVYEDGYKDVIPIRYGVNILEWRSLPEKNKIVSEHWESQNIYAYEADLVNCSSDPENRPVNFYAYEWVNKRMGKKIKEVNMHSSANYQALTNVYRKPVTEPMQNNAIMLLCISKVKKKVPYIDR